MRALCCSRHKLPHDHSTPVPPLSQVVCAVVLAAVFAATSAGARQAQPGADLAQTLARVGQRVEEWYSRAQSIVSTETVVIQPLRSDLTPMNSPRRLAYELRVAWDPAE